MAAERAVTAGMGEASADLKTDLRRQITSAGLGERLARTWRSEVYPRGQKSIGAAGFVWSKAPDIVRAFDQGAVIRSKRGLFLAIPTALAGRLGRSIGGAREKITPQGWERRTGLKLRFVYRRGAPSLLVVDDVRITKGGRVVANVSRRKGVVSPRKSGGSVAIVFILVPQVLVAKAPRRGGRRRQGRARAARPHPPELARDQSMTKREQALTALHARLAAVLTAPVLRNVNWSAARAKYDISTGIRTREQMAEVIAFFRPAGAAPTASASATGMTSRRPASRSFPPRTRWSGSSSSNTPRAHRPSSASSPSRSQAPWSCA